MKKNTGLQNKEGFTLIEAILVMGIAGLIFLLMFLALPALQRNERDTERKDDITKLIKHLKTYQDNHRGSLPKTDDNEASGVTSASDGDWGAFYRDVLGSDFVDPNGEPYVLEVSKCDGMVVDGDCNGFGVDNMDEFPNGFKLYIVLQAKCAGDEKKGAVATSLLRRFAVIYKLEGGGLYCAEG